MDYGEHLVPLDDADLQEPAGSVRTDVHHEPIAEVPGLHGKGPGVSCIFVSHAVASGAFEDERLVVIHIDKLPSHTPYGKLPCRRPNGVGPTADDATRTP